MKRKYFVIASFVVIALFGYLFAFRKNEISIGSEQKGGLVIFSNNKKDELAKSLLTGLECANASKRPIAVMMPSDIETRPLSGISQADLVLEMPVAPNGVTRAMAIFQCDVPKEIGSVRSARDDFIPLAGGFKVIYAHWGGEHDALGKLNKGIVNNVDAMKYEGSTYYRKSSAPRPHNGFTTLERVYAKASELGYTLTDSFSGYPHEEKENKRNLGTLVSNISIPYPYPYNVTWTYNGQNKTYMRSRGNKAETDRNDGSQVGAQVVVVMDTTSRFLREQYIEVKTQGSGSAHIYQNGTVIEGTWRKDPTKLDSKLFFYDLQGKEIKFVPGKIWIEIVAQ